MTNTLPTPTGAKRQPTDLTSLFAAAARKVESERGKLIFGFDATASREMTWAKAMELQKAMFGATRALEVQLAVFRGRDLEVSPWETKPEVLEDLMGQITCEAGNTQITRTLQHIMDENAAKPRRPVNAFVFIGDTFEEWGQSHQTKALAKALGDLKVRGFFFLDSTDWNGNASEPNPRIEAIYKELATLSGGAYAPFNLQAVKFLEDLLASVAAFASGGLTALSDRASPAAKLLIGQIKK